LGEDKDVIDIFGTAPVCFKFFVSVILSNRYKNRYFSCQMVKIADIKNGIFGVGYLR
jgi:hypothetical protein